MRRLGLSLAVLCLAVACTADRAATRRSDGPRVTGSAAPVVPTRETIVECELPTSSTAPVEPPVAPPRALRIDLPREGETIRCRSGFVPVSGRVTAIERLPLDLGALDLMVVVDRSGSTKYPSGVDVDGDGVIGETQRRWYGRGSDIPCTDPGDSVLAAEIAAALALLDRLAPEYVRVGVVSFAGEIDPRTGRQRLRGQRNAWLEAPLTSDRELVREGLDDIRWRGGSGGTDMEAGLELAVRELLSREGSRSVPRSDARKVILFLTDGVPSLPFGLGNQTDPEDIVAVQRAASLAAAAGVAIHVYGLGPLATDSPIAATEMARLTSGTYTPVDRPGDVIGSLSLPGIPVIRVRAVNLEGDVESDPTDIHVLVGGSFVGRVRALQGPNRIRITALLGDEVLDSVELAFVLEPTR